MIGIGTLVNTAAIIIGGLLGLLIGKKLKETQQEGLIKACGVSVMFIAIAGAMENMLQTDGVTITSAKGMLVVLCITLGAVVGELINIEGGFERFGEWLKRKTGNSNDNSFVNAFVTASFTVCIGAMAIVGSIQDGIGKDPTTLLVKSILDFVILIVMASTLGKGAIFSAIPVLIFEGSITLLSFAIAPVLTDLAVDYISMVGSILIFCVGINLVFGKKVSVANMLPAVLFAVLAAYLPIAF